MARVRINVENTLIYTLGLTSTWQLISVGGLNLFTVIILLFVAYEILRKKRIILTKTITLLGISILVSLMGNLLLDSAYLKNIAAWKSACLNSSIVFLLILLVYGFIQSMNNEKISIFFQGVFYSCCIQVAWAYMQLIYHFLLKGNLNEMVFVRLLKMWNTIEVYNVNSQFTLTGLNLNSGVMTPILLLVFFMCKKKMTKFAVIILFFMTGNTTTLIAGILLIGSHFCRLLLFNGWLKKNIVWEIIVIVLLSVLVLIWQPGIAQRIMQAINTLIGKLSSIKTYQWTEGSTFVHFRYYQSLPFIISHIGLLRIFIGFGFRCGGMPFVVYYNQYPDIVYSTESDIISTLYGLGMVGMIVFYSILFRIIKKGYRTDRNYAIFEAIILIAGIFYSQQMNWLILVELLLLEMIRRKIDFQELISH